MPNNRNSSGEVLVASAVVFAAAAVIGFLWGVRACIVSEQRAVAKALTDALSGDANDLP